MNLNKDIKQQILNINDLKISYTSHTTKETDLSSIKINPKHKHENKYQIIYPHQGIITLQVDQLGKFLTPITKGIFINKNVYHQASFNSVKMHHNFYFDEVLVPPNLRDKTFVFNATPFIRQLLLRSLEIKDLHPHNSNILNVLLNEIYLHQSTELMLPLFNFDIIKDLRLHKAIELIFAHNFQDPLLLDNVSKECGISSKQLSRYFEKELNISFKQYIGQVKFQKAISLFCENLGSTQIAYELGFSETSAFTRFFKNFCGKSPSEYLKSAKLRL